MVHYTLLCDPVSGRPLMGFITDGTMGTYVGVDGADREDMNFRLPFAMAHNEIPNPSTVDQWMLLAQSNMILAAQDSADVESVDEARAAIAVRLQAVPPAPRAKTNEGRTS